MTDRVRVEKDNHVATVTLTRAEKKNAVDFEMFEAITDAADRLRDDASIRAVVLDGDGPDFCAGIDISVFSGDGPDVTDPSLMEPRRPSGANFFQAVAMCWRELPVPVIASLRGSVFGAGLQIALGADLRFASPDARLSIMEIKWGLIPDMAITATLPGIVRQDHVRELCYTGRVVAADEALAIGLVTHVVDDPLASAAALASEIANRSPDAIRAAKFLISESWRRQPVDTLKREAELQTMVMGGKNRREAAMANFEKRRPDFVDPEA